MRTPPLAALAGQQVALNDLLDQRVPERIGVAVRVRDEQVVLYRLAQRRQQLGLVQPAGGGQQPVTDPLAGDRGHPQRVLARVRQCVDPGREYVVDGGLMSYGASYGDTFRVGGLYVG